MSEPFKPSSLSIRELFGNTDSLYKIPQYQRPYKWEDEQVGKLWDDIFEAYENKEENYFLGSIITAKPRDDEQSAYVDVVDGQQRLTTLMILFCVIRDLFPSLNEAQNNNPFAVNIQTIKSSIALHGNFNRLKLFTHAKHQSDFESLILNGKVTELSKPKKSEIRIDEEPSYKFINTAVIFRDKLKDLEKNESGVSEKLINYLFKDVKIIRIDCKNKEFAIKLFQVLNDRGMDLTSADLIKSFLLGKVYDSHKDDSDTFKRKEDQFISDWREIEQSVKNCDINLNDLFTIYLYYLLGSNPKKSLSDEFEAYCKAKNPNEVIMDVKSFVNSYVKDIYEQQDKVLYSFWYIPWTVYWKTILLTALHTKYSDYEALKIQLRRFYYLYWIAGKTLSQIKQTSFNLVKWIKENQSIQFIEDELNKKIQSDNDIVSQAKCNLASEQIDSESWIKPLLLLMEYNVTDDSKLPVFIELNQNLHLEHILPVSSETENGWSHVSKEDANKWRKSAGNLTLLGGAKNIAASNHAFDVKMAIYKGDGNNKKMTSFDISKQLVEDYEKGIYNKQWTVESMIARWEWFFGEVGELFDIDVQEIIKKHQPELVDE